MAAGNFNLALKVLLVLNWNLIVFAENQNPDLKNLHQSWQNWFIFFTVLERKILLCFAEV